jgi:trehalose 6-phosphate phosphatase
MQKPDQKFWNKVQKARERLLALDYDGTLVTFHVDRMAARPACGILAVLNSIERQSTTRLAIVSGRPLHELEELLGAISNRLILVGAHGWEGRDAGGNLFQQAPPEEVRKQLKLAYDMALDYGTKEPVLMPKIIRRVERKNASVAVHVRGMQTKTAEDWLDYVRALWSTLTSPSLDITEFKGGIELRTSSRDKGLAVRELLERFPSTDLIVYMGDDMTDEDVFSVLQGLDIGVGIRVGEAGETSADYLVRDVDAVREFLIKWEHITHWSLEGDKT